MKKLFVFGAFATVAVAAVFVIYTGGTRPSPVVEELRSHHGQSDENSLATRLESEMTNAAVANNAEVPTQVEDDVLAVAEDEQLELDRIGTPSSFGEDSAMVAIFGDYNEAERGTLIPKSLTENWDIQQAKWLITPMMTALYREGGVLKAVAVVKRQELEDGEVVWARYPTSKIGIYLFRREGSRWYFEKGNGAVIEMSASPEKLIKLGDDKHGLFFEGGDVQQGYVFESAAIIDLTAEGISLLRTIEMGENNEGTCSDDPKEREESGNLDECWSYVGSIGFIRKPGDDYYMLRVSHSGTDKANDGQVVEVDRDTFYRKLDRTYEPADAMSAQNGDAVPESEWMITEEPEESFEMADDEDGSEEPAESDDEARKQSSPAQGPSFDCDQAISEREKTICQPDQGELQEAERKLVDEVEALEKSLGMARKDWLYEAQQNWLLLNGGCDARDTNWSEGCLLPSYRARTKELELGVFVNPVPPGRMPYRVVLPNGVEGEFEFVMNGDSLNQVELWFTSGTERRVVWSGESSTGDTPLASLSLIALQGDKLVLEITVGGDTESFYYLAMESSGNFVFQGQKKGDESGGAGSDQYVRQWVSGADGPLLKIDRLYSGTYDYGFEYFHANDQQRLYEFRFNGSPWKESLPEPQRWLDSPDAASRYLALYREIAAQEGGGPAATRTDCIEGGVNWTLAVKSLSHWLDVVLEARDRGVAYDQAATIFTKVMASSERFAFNEGELELFHALDYVRRRIEAKEGWEKQLAIAYREASGHQEEAEQDEQVGYENGEGDGSVKEEEYTGDAESESEYGEGSSEEDFFVQIECLDDDARFEYEIYRNGWFYNFWVRRYGDGSYEVAKLVIDYALRSKPGR